MSQSNNSGLSLALTKEEYDAKYGEDYWAAMEAQGGEDRNDYQIRAHELGKMQLRRLNEKYLGCVKALTEYQFRINNRLDIYPRNQKWHDIKNNTRGDYRPNRLEAFVINYIERVK